MDTRVRASSPTLLLFVLTHRSPFSPLDNPCLLYSAGIIRFRLSDIPLSCSLVIEQNILLIFVSVRPFFHPLMLTSFSFFFFALSRPHQHHVLNLTHILQKAGYTGATIEGQLKTIDLYILPRNYPKGYILL